VRGGLAIDLDREAAQQIHDRRYPGSRDAAAPPGLGN
jgi:hypothetical protein